MIATPTAEADRVEQTQRMMRASPMFFARTVLRGPERAPFYGRYGVGPHHLEWDKLMTQHLRAAVLAPRGLGKSMAWSFALPLWMAYHRIDEGLLIISSSDENAKRVLSEIKREIEENEALQHLYPRFVKGRVWRAHSATLSNGFTITARGVGSKIRGMHVSVISDDMMSDEAFYSEVYRTKTKEYWLSTVTPIPGPHQRLYAVGTPFHYSDILYKDLRDNAAYEHKTYKALNDQDESLWPDFLTTEQLLARKKELGEIAWACQMQCDPVSQEGSLFPTAMFMGPPQEQRTVCMRMDAAQIRQLDLTVVAGVDVAFSGSAKADSFVITILGVSPRGERWIIDIIRRTGIDFQTQIGLVNEYGRKYDCETIYIEANAAQRVWGDELMRETDLPIRQFLTTKSKHDLQSGLPALRLLAEAKKWRIPRGDAYSIEMSNILLGELAGFTFVSGKCQSLAAHDDTVMSLHLADKAARWAGKFAPTTDVPVAETLKDSTLASLPDPVDTLQRLQRSNPWSGI